MGDPEGMAFLLKGVVLESSRWASTPEPLLGGRFPEAAPRNAGSLSRELPRRRRADQSLACTEGTTHAL